MRTVGRKGRDAGRGVAEAIGGVKESIRTNPTVRATGKAARDVVVGGMEKTGRGFRKGRQAIGELKEKAKINKGMRVTGRGMKKVVKGIGEALPSEAKRHRKWRAEQDKRNEAYVNPQNESRPEDKFPVITEEKLQEENDFLIKKFKDFDKDEATKRQVDMSEGSIYSRRQIRTEKDEQGRIEYIISVPTPEDAKDGAIERYQRVIRDKEGNPIKMELARYHTYKRSRDL